MKKNLLIISILIILSQVVYAQRWGGNISGGYSFNTGEFADYYENGFHGSAGAFYMLGSNMQVSLFTGYSSWSLKKDFFNEKWNEAYPRQTIDAEAPVTAIPLLLGFKYYIGKSRRMKPYFMFSAGFHFVTTELNGTKTYYLDPTLQTPLYTENISRSKEHSTETTVGFGGGIAFPISKRLSLDVNGRYNIINDSKAIQEIDNPSDSSLKERTLQYVSLMVGFDFKF